MNRPNFTREQEDWLCEAIGHWYFEWKHKMTDGSPHRLGYATELLKSVICDDIPDERAKEILEHALGLRDKVENSANSQEQENRK
jgi:hypothetical protein